MRDLNVPMSSTLDNLADSDDYDSVEDFEDFENGFSQVNTRLNSIGLHEKHRDGLYDRNRGNASNSYARTSDFGFDHDSLSTTEFQEISPELNIKHMGAYKNFQKSQSLIEKTYFDASEDSFATTVTEREKSIDRDERREVKVKQAKAIDKHDLEKIHSELIDINNKILVRKIR
jgi:hypothetical protein